jgi:tetratricopeptide (TPR) repeat protein
MGRWIDRKHVIAAGLVAAGLLAAANGYGQQPAPAPVKVPAKPAPGDDPKFTDAVTLPRNPESKRLIQAAQDYIRKKEWRIAAECLQSLLETPEDSFIEVKRSNDAGQESDVRVSVRAEANRLIGELPAEGLESYQLQYGQAAADRLREAVAAADPVLLAEVAQRYFHTKSGLTATDLLGTYHLDRGQYLMASLCYERLLARPDADKLPPRLLFKAALAAKRACSPQAVPLATRLTGEIGRGDLTLGRARLSPEVIRAELDREAVVDVAVGLSDWPMFRGNASRTAQAQGSTAYLQPRWTASLIRPEPPRPDDKSAVNWVEQHLDRALLAFKDKPVLPAFFPVSANGRLLVRAYDGVAAYALKDLRLDGRDYRAGENLWRAPAANSLFVTVRDDINSRRMGVENWYNNFYLNNNVGPPGVFFENSVLGSLSHDGQRTYFIDDLAVPPLAMMLGGMNGFNPFGGNQMNMAPFTDDVRCSRLYAADLDTGKLSWAILGGRSTPNRVEPSAEPKKDLSAAVELQDSFFLGPPLPLGGKLYLLVEKNSELRLVCLDPNKCVPSPLRGNEQVPDLVWAQSLGTANNPLPADSLRRLQACHLAYADGILVCPTNAGAVLGVDLLSRSLVWAYSYRAAAPSPGGDDLPQQIMMRRRFMASSANAGPTAGERWRPSAPCVAKGRVVFTAHDGADVDIHCVSLRDGQRLWRAKRDGNNDLYLAGIADDHVLIVAKNHVRALKLSDGSVAWKCTETGLPSGQGVLADGVYYLPLGSSGDPKSSDKGPEICAIDVRGGKIVGRSKSRTDTPGNLLFAEGELVSQSVKAVNAFPLLKVKQAEIARYLANNPNDPTGLKERGELHLYDGEVREAVRDLRAALSHDPPAEVRSKARLRLHEALTRMMQSDFASAEQYLAEYEELSRVTVPPSADAEERQDQTRRRASYLELLGKGRERQGRLTDAFAAYEQFGELAGVKELVDLIEEPNTRARPDIWSRGRIQALLAGAGPDERRRLEAEIEARWDRVRKSADLDSLRKFVTLFGSLSSAGKAARIELAGRLMATGEPDDLTEAERVLAVLCYSPAQRRDDPAAAARALELMTRVCVRRGQYENAVGFYRQLAEEYPDVPVRDGLTGKQVFDELSTDKRFVPYLDAPAVIWSGPLAGRKQFGNFPLRETSLTVEPVGDLLPYFERHRIALEMRPEGGQAPWVLRVFDRSSGEERWRVGGLPAPASVFNPTQSAVPYAFARGQTLVLHLNHMVYAFDLGERRELWRRDLLGKDRVLLTNPNTGMMFDGNFGPAVMTAREERLNLGRVAVVEASYVALQTREGLVALDPTRPGPSTLWSRGDVTPKAQVFGDDRHVFVYDPDAGAGRPRCRALRAQDGASVPVPDFTEMIQKKNPAPRAVRGRLLITEPQGQAVRLYDVMAGREVWRRDFAPGTVVARDTDPNLIGAVEPDGLFTLLDSKTGQVRFTSRLQADHADKLASITLLADRERIYLALEKRHQGGGRLDFMSAAGPALRTAKVNGPVYALFRRTGKLDWVCDFVPHQMLLLERWADLPVLLFASQFEKTAANGNPERQGVKVTAVDKVTGKLRFDDELVRNNQFQSLTANPAAGRIELVRQDLKVILQTEDAAAAPEPASPPPTPRRRVVLPAAVPVPAPAAPGENR